MGIISLSISVFYILLFSHSCDFHVRYYRTPPFYWERTVSVCIMTLYSVFVLCVFPPPLSFYSSRILLAYFSSVSMHAPLCAASSLAIRLEGSIFGGPYIWRNISISLAFFHEPSIFENKIKKMMETIIFSVHCTSLAYNKDPLLSYLKKQRIPFHSKCVEVSMKTQEHFDFYLTRTQTTYRTQTSASTTRFWQTILP